MPREPMRVLVILTGREGGGVRNHVLHDYLHQARVGITFEYLCLEAGRFHEELTERGAAPTVIGGAVPIQYPGSPLGVALKLIGMLPKLWTVHRRVLAEVRKRKPDLVYTHYPYLHVLAGWAAWRGGRPAIGRFPSMMNTRKLLGLQRVIASTIFGHSLDGVITISRTAHETLWGAARRKSRVVYNGAELEEIRAAVSGIEKTPGRVVIVGRITPGKKQHLAIEAVAAVRARGIDCSLEIVGGPAESGNAYYERLAGLVGELGLEEHVRFRGWLSPPYEAVASASVCLNCSTVEGFGYVIIEGIACGTPLIVSDRGAPAELIDPGRTGLHVPADDKDALADAIAGLLSDGETRARLAEEAWRDARARFGIDAHMNRLRDVFDEVAAGRPRTSG